MSADVTKLINKKRNKRIQKHAVLIFFLCGFFFSLDANYPNGNAVCVRVCVGLFDV